MFSLTSHPTQLPHLFYAYLILVLVIYRATLCPIQNCQSYNCDKIFPSSWAVLLYHIKHSVLLHFNHLTWIRWFTSSISMSFCAMDPRYLNCVTCVVIWSPTFISKLEMLRLLLKLDSIHSILLLHKHKSYASKICLHSCI